MNPSVSRVPLRIESRRTQKRMLRAEPPLTAAEVRWIAENRPRVRGDCAKVPRPCPFVACRHHLWLDVLHGGTIAFVEGVQESCSLDVADRAKGVGLRSAEVAVYTGRTRQSAEQVLAGALIRLRIEADKTPTTVGALRAGGGFCALCGRRGVGWIPLCHDHARSFGTSPHARRVLGGERTLLEGLADFVQRQRSLKAGAPTPG